MTRDHFEIITQTLTSIETMTPGTVYHLVRAEPGISTGKWAIYRTAKGAPFDSRERVSPVLSLSRLDDWVDGAYEVFRSLLGTRENKQESSIPVVDPATLPAPVVVVWEQYGGNVEITGAGRVEVYYAKFGEGVGHCKKHGVDSVECEKDAGHKCEYYTGTEREAMIPEHARHTWIALTEV